MHIRSSLQQFCVQSRIVSYTYLHTKTNKIEILLSVRGCVMHESEMSKAQNGNVISYLFLTRIDRYQYSYRTSLLQIPKVPRSRYKLCTLLDYISEELLFRFYDLRAFDRLSIFYLFYFFLLCTYFVFYLSTLFPSKFRKLLLSIVYNR